MSKTVIQVENLGKKYLIWHHTHSSYVALRDVITEGAISLAKKVLNPFAKNNHHPGYEEFWALKDVEVKIKEGERFGIIGRNGAGKSTLLKLLSRITDPSNGRISIKGRVASLLEVGTGFHPELTGRENIYLNGAILGMNKREIKRKFDEIVNFAEVEKFLDTPVKRYSSGMYVRLAFAVAAHLETEILLIDEVLAVGDAQFQKKCMGKMSDITKEEGKTILFVSHNMGAIKTLCQTGIYLDSGKIQKYGNCPEIVEAYLQSSNKNILNNTAPEELVKEGKAKFIEWKFIDSATKSDYSCFSRENCKIAFTFVAKRDISDGRIAFLLRNSEGLIVLSASSTDVNSNTFKLEKGIYQFTIITRLPLQEGTYNMLLHFKNGKESIDNWQAEPEMVVIPVSKNTLSPKYHGILDEKIEFEHHRLKNL